MSKEIRVDEDTKVKIKGTLDNLDITMNSNINRFSDIIDRINMLIVNPEIGNIVTQFIPIKDDKVLVKDNIAKFKEVLDQDMQEILELDTDISNKIGVDKNE